MLEIGSGCVIFPKGEVKKDIEYRENGIFTIGKATHGIAENVQIIYLMRD